jgi:hypothetical protein
MKSDTCEIRGTLGNEEQPVGLGRTLNESSLRSSTSRVLSRASAGVASDREIVAPLLHTHCTVGLGGLSPEAELPQNARSRGVRGVPGGDAGSGTRLATLSWTTVPPWNPKRTVSEVREQ